MGKHRKVNYRAEQARKRNLEKAENSRKAAAQKAWWGKNGKTVIIAAAAAVVVIAAVWLLCSYNIGPGGSIPNFFGRLIGVEENWIVGNAAADGETPRYYKLAAYDAPEGYTAVEYNVHNDELVQDMRFKDESGEKLVSDFFLSHVQGRTPEDQLANLTVYISSLKNSGALKGTIAGMEADYLYLVSDENTIDQPGMSAATLAIYYKTPYDAIVSVNLNSKVTPAAEVPTMEQMLAEAEVLLANLEVVQ
ncbi:MAG: hypothetical protein IJZ74_12635 [Clostridia bacterium]|nr:hypothetical protein [Clostridia bacterium]